MEIAHAQSTPSVRMVDQQINPRRPRPAATAATHPYRLDGVGDGAPRRRHGSRTKRIRQLKLLTLGLLVILAVVMIGWIGARVDFQAAESERFAHAMELRKARTELESLRAMTSDLQTRLDSLVQGRLPGLRALQFDHTFSINTHNVRNVSFRATGLGETKQYEYSAVLENPTDAAVTPKVRFLLFDEVGIQTGAVALSKKAASTNSDMEFLIPGETRAYTAAIPITTKSEPRYFLVLGED